MEFKNVQNWGVDGDCVLALASQSGDGLYIGVCLDDGVLIQDATGQENVLFAEMEAVRQEMEAGSLDTSDWYPTPETVTYPDLDADQDMRIFAVCSPSGFSIDYDAAGTIQARMAISAGAATIKLCGIIDEYGEKPTIDQWELFADGRVVESYDD